jgi:hypothetical protein
MQLGKPHQRSSQNIARQPPAFAGGEKLFGLGIGKTIGSGDLINKLFMRSSAKEGQSHAYQPANQ